MARARNIKPGLFKNEILGVADPLLTLLFEGLWILADKAGRLEDRPLRIKGELFPYREGINVDQMLSWLHENGFIVRYLANGAKFIEVTNFSKHQNPHKNETESEMPAPEKIGITSEKIGITRADSLLLIPDSLNLIPDSLIPEEKHINLSVDSLRPNDEGQEDARHTPQLFENIPESRRTPAKPSIPDCPHLEILNLWAEVLPTLPQHLPQQWRGSRSDHLRARWKEKASEKGWATKEEGLAYFRTVFELISESSFLCGRTQTSDPSRRPFQATLEWVVLPGNWAKVLEQRYNDRVAA